MVVFFRRSASNLWNSPLDATKSYKMYLHLVIFRKYHFRFEFLLFLLFLGVFFLLEKKTKTKQNKKKQKKKQHHQT